MPREKGRKLVAQNKKALHDYHIGQKYEAGMVLTGTEVKSLRNGRCSLVDAFATIDDGEVWLRNANIPEYACGTWTNHAARRNRKLLLNRREIDKLEREIGKVLRGEPLGGDDDTPGSLIPSVTAIPKTGKPATGGDPAPA